MLPNDPNPIIPIRLFLYGIFQYNTHAVSKVLRLLPSTEYCSAGRSSNWKRIGSTYCQLLIIIACNINTCHYKISCHWTRVLKLFKCQLLIIKTNHVALMLQATTTTPTLVDVSLFTHVGFSNINGFFGFQSVWVFPIETAIGKFGLLR